MNPHHQKTTTTIMTKSPKQLPPRKNKVKQNNYDSLSLCVADNVTFRLFCFRKRKELSLFKYIYGNLYL